MTEAWPRESGAVAEMRLLGVRVENVGGFQTAELDVSGDRLLVGENNSGKTSLLRVLDWVFNTADAALLDGYRQLSDTERKLLVPARPTRNKARRLLLRIEIPDGRTARKYGAVAHVAELRIQFRMDATYAKLSAPTRGERPESEPRATELLVALQQDYCALYVAAARDARSQVFADSLRRALTTQFRQELLQQGPGRNTKAESVRRSTDSLRQAGEKEAGVVWSAAQKHLRGVFSPDARFELSIDSERMLQFLTSEVEPTFSLGDHDQSKVPVDQLGAGTQSVLAMALTQLSMANAPQKLLLLEEPEAFLHPSAQRTLAWQILQPSDIRLVATTHSPLVLAEANPADVVVLRSHIVYPAIGVPELQESKDRYQLSTWVSGSMFDRSLLLVEGPGDLALFETLRRRLEEAIPVAILSRLRVAAVGGKTSFGPWLRLLRRYREPGSGSLAFSVLVCADSADAGADVLRALKESSIGVSAELQGEIRSFLDGFVPDSLSREDAREVASRTRKANKLSDDVGLPVHFMPVDLEYAATAALSDVRAQEFAALAGIFEVSTVGKLAARMGSKGGDGPASDTAGAKAPYARAELGRFLDWSEISIDLKDLLWRWLLPAFDGAAPTRPSQLK